jgi:hypothetical protein
MIITLCGSLRFEEDIDKWNKKLSLSGHLVFGMSSRGKIESEDEKTKLDLIHLFKIEMSDAVVVVNPGGYIGESVKREMTWAEMKGKTVYTTDEGWFTAHALVDCKDFG